MPKAYASKLFRYRVIYLSQDIYIVRIGCFLKKSHMLKAKQ